MPARCLLDASDQGPEGVSLGVSHRTQETLPREGSNEQGGDQREDDPVCMSKEGLG